MADKEIERKKRVFMKYREGEKEKSFFFFFFHLIKGLSLESRRCPLTGKNWRSKERIKEKIFGYENQIT